MYTFEDINHEDIKSFIMEFGYGNCHLLSQYMSKEFSKDIGIIKSDPSGMVVHSFIFLNDKYAFDAHGIDTVENTIKRYESFSSEYNECNVKVERHITKDGIKELSFWCCFDEAEEDFMKLEFNYLDSITNIKEKIKDIDESEKLKENVSVVLKARRLKL